VKCEELNNNVTEERMRIDKEKGKNKLEINMHHLRGNAIPAGRLSDFDEILCCCGIPIGPFR